MIPGMLFGADSTARKRVRYCEIEGDDNPPTVMAAVRLRPVGHDSPRAGTTDLGAPTTTVDWHVETTSVAQLDPGWDAESVHVQPGDSIGTNQERYVATVGVRLDTLTISMVEDPSAEQRWQVCNVGGPMRPGSTGYWMFLEDVPNWVQVVRWTPANASWSRVITLADSMRGAASASAHRDMPAQR